MAKGMPDQHFWIRSVPSSRIIARGIARHPWDDHLDPNSSRIDGPADATLQYALEISTERTAHPLPIIGLGKLGGRELFMGPTWISFSFAKNNLAKLRSGKELALAIMDLVSKKTGDGLRSKQTRACARTERRG